MEQETAPFSFFQKQRSEKHRKEGKTGVMFDIQEELKKLPGKPGVYIMHDAKDTIIYGKSHQSEKQGSAVFSKQQKSWNQERTDGATDRPV